MSYGRPPPDVEGMTSLKVDNLTYRTSPETLRRVFEKYGRVGDVYIPRDRYTKESRGFAFVRFHDKRDAEDAMDAMDGALLDGRELRVQMARYGRPPDSHYSRRGAAPRRYGGGHGRRSRRYVLHNLSPILIPPFKFSVNLSIFSKFECEALRPRGTENNTCSNPCNA